MKKYLKEQKGQGLLEYIILTSLIGIVCLIAVGKFGNKLKSQIEQMDRKISKKINIGR